MGTISTIKGVKINNRFFKIIPNSWKEMGGNGIGITQERLHAGNNTIYFQNILKSSDTEAGCSFSVRMEPDVKNILEEAVARTLSGLGNIIVRGEFKMKGDIPPDISFPDNTEDVVEIRFVRAS